MQSKKSGSSGIYNCRSLNPLLLWVQQVYMYSRRSLLPCYEYMYCVKARRPTVLLPDVCLCSVPSCLRNFVALLFPILVSCSEGIKIWYELPGDSKTNCRNKITQVSSLNDACSLFLFDSYYACIIALSFLFDSYYACIIALSFFKFFFVVRLKNGPAVHLWKCPAEIWPAS